MEEMAVLQNFSVCPICQTQTSVENLSDINSYKVNCPRCGKFQLTSSALTMFQRSDVLDKELSLSYTIRQNQNDRKRYQINEISMRKLLKAFIPIAPHEQANKLLIWIGENVGKPDGETEEELNNLVPIIGALDESGVKYVVDYLDEQYYITHRGFSYSFIDGERNPPRDLLRAQITFKGWSKLDEIEKTNKDSSLAFMAMKFGDNDLDNLYENTIKQTVKDTGFIIRKVNEEKKAGSIDDKLRVEIRRSKFMIADLTHDNNGAYWEAGYAEGLGIPVIYICEKEKFNKKKTHFDTNHHLTVLWDKDNLIEFAKELKATIRATFPTEAKMDD